MEGTNTVFHFASNPDIAKAVSQPDIDFWEGTYLTNNILEAMRMNNVKKLLYASGSGVYGEGKELWLDENYSPMLPISTYGSSKLSCEALICSYCHMFDMQAAAFRFANVVGSNQTHGVVYDFIRRLLINDAELEILGDGSQSKPYIFVSDVLRAMLIVWDNLEKYQYFNVAPMDFITVTEIANVVTEVMELKNVKYNYTGGDRGWKGDIPIVRLKTDKIRDLGWNNEFNSKQAIQKSAKSILNDAKMNKFNWEEKI
jgi:UDP-glucose 4-epimerase